MPNPIANTVTITTPGMRYHISGPLRPGIAAITFVNTDDETHMMAFTRLKPGVTLDQMKKALGASEQAALALMADGPNTSYGTPSEVGAGMSTTVVAENLPAGNYAVACFLASKTGQPHWQMGMITMLRVTGAKATEKPKVQGRITVDDKRITLPDGFAGHGIFLVTDTGKAPHNLSLARLSDGTALADYVGHVGMAMQSNTPVDGGGGVLAGGIDGLAPGQSAYLDLDLPTGHYGYISTADVKGPDLPGQHGEFDAS